MKLQILFLLLVLPITSAYAQSERPARTWIGGGFTYTHSTADDAREISGAYLDSAYYLQHGFQARFNGVYLNRPSIPNLFSGEYGPTRATSELRYSAVLVGYLPVESLNNVFVGGGVSAVRHFFNKTSGSYAMGGPYRLYNSSVNPAAVAGVRIGRKSEAVFAYYFPDTYSYSNLRGFGGEFSHAHKLSGHLHIRAGVRARYSHFREGVEHEGRRAGEVSGFVGFHFQ